MTRYEDDFVMTDQRAKRGRQAAERQGLVSLRDALAARLDVSPILHNTGGYCMALLADVGEDVIVAAGEGNGTYYIARYPLSVWEQEPDESRGLEDFDPADHEVYGIESAVDRWRQLATESH